MDYSAFIVARIADVVRKAFERLRAGTFEESSNVGPAVTTALIAGGESRSVEFKSSARWNVKMSGHDWKLEHVIAKTIGGFMNAGGGTLLIGVADDGTTRGLEEDYALVKGSGRDGYELFLVDLVQSRIGHAEGALIEVSFDEVDGADVCRRGGDGEFPTGVRDAAEGREGRGVLGSARELDEEVRGPGDGRLPGATLGRDPRTVGQPRPAGRGAQPSQAAVGPDHVEAGDRSPARPTLVRELRWLEELAMILARILLGRENRQPESRMTASRIFQPTDLRRDRSFIDYAREHGRAHLRDVEGEGLVLLFEEELARIEGLAERRRRLSEAASAVLAVAVEGRVPEMWAWLAALDAEDRQDFGREVIGALRIDFSDPEAEDLTRVLDAWRETAAALRDRERHAALIAEIEIDPKLLEESDPSE